ncbi:MAG: hypothetical protein A3A81_08400 [Omnitrophica bacterium RIFCSPLOWO2_01_FULL_45_10b]|nr:MAG: hypothetical protein A3A81_08400 [Omnitrophica bacterium RIFCSPLOWO2_01_FULL_45_10b]
MIVYEEILRQFQKQKVKYVIVGGVAFNLLGGYRSTLDMDILVEMSDENLAKVVTILKKQGYRVKQPVDPMGIANQKIREDWIKNKHMKAFNFYKGEKTYEEVEIIIDSPVNFQEAAQDVVKVKVSGLTLPVISPRKFIQMKKSSGRDKDLMDIEQIKIARNLK